MVIKVFPLPGFADETIITRDCPSLPNMNSRLVRTTLNASLTRFRLFSLTTIVCVSGNFFLRNIEPCSAWWYANGISPTKGIVIFSKSLRPLTLVFIFSAINMTITGINKPATKATSKIFFFSGAVGNMLPPAGVIIRVLYAVNACESSFSSRFWSKYR